MVRFVVALPRVVRRRVRGSARLDRRPDRIDRLLLAGALVYVPLACACIVGWIVDDRMIDGHSSWAKPTKFAVSIGLAGAATVWLHRRLMPSRLVRAATLGFTIAMAAEQVLITMQAVRGVRSHFNVETPFDGLVFQAMGALISIAFVALAVLACSAMVRPPADPIVRTVVRQGIWLVTAAGAIGFTMSANGGHAIGGSGAMTSMPITGWSTVHGDLRPAHFVGVHGLQLLIMLAAFGARLRWPADRIHAAVTALSAATVVVMVGLTAQAFAGLPISSVSSTAVAAAASLVAIMIVRRRDSVVHASRQSPEAAQDPSDRRLDEMVASR